jgi:hypothetical protein
MNSKLLCGLVTVFVFASAPLSRAASDDTALLTALGYTTSQSILLSHLGVGTLADAFMAKVYKDERATDVLSRYINITQGMKDQLNKLIEAGTLTKDDSEFMRRAVVVLDLVLEESRAFKAFVGTKSEANAQSYDQARKKALAEIKGLLKG